MKFNSGENSIVDDIHYWAGTDSTTYPIADIRRNANQAIEVVTQKILKSDNVWEYDDSNATDLPIALTDLVSGQSDYTLAVAHLKIVRVRVKDPQGNWITLDPVNRKSLTDFDLAGTGTPSKYDKLGASVLLNSTPNYSATGGIEIQFQRTSEYFTSADDEVEPGFASSFHRLISLYSALDYTEPNDLDSRSKKIIGRIKDLETSLEEFYSSRDRDYKQALDVRKEDYGASGLY